MSTPYRLQARRYGAAREQDETQEPLVFPTVVGPNNYPTSCTPEARVFIADMLAHGASLRAAAGACGLPPARVQRWYDLGKIAAERDEEGENVYLDFYIACLQASSRAECIASSRVYEMAPDFWLTHHPEARKTWRPALADDVDSAKPTQITGEVVDAVPAVSSQPLSNDQLAAVLNQLHEINTLNAKSTLSVVKPIDTSESEVG